MGRSSPGTAARNPDKIVPPGKLRIRMTVNGVERQLEIAPWTTLLDLLREHLDLTGTKGCDHGQCGACTVLVDGRRINSVPDARSDAGGPRDHHGGRAGARTARCMPCSRRSSIMTPSSAATARRDRSVGRRPAGRRCAAHRRGRAGIHERQSLPLRRLSEHRGRDHAGPGEARSGRAMNPFSYDARPAMSRKRAAGSRHARREVHRRRHQPDRSDEGGRRAA